jgi:cytochrome bd ubiquinol oxidase subunit I
VLSTMVAAASEPSQLLPARTQMAFTLGIHIVLVPFGVAFVFLALIANYRGLRHGDHDALVLAERWSKVAAVLFAVGAVTGTVLSFELGLLWPGLMGRFGAAYGIPFVVEGLFFFLEAIFVAIYIYGWKRMAPWLHFWAGIPVVLAGIGGALSVVAANSWMNDPAGYTLRHGRVVDVDPMKVIFNGAFWHEGLHMLLAAYIVAGFLVAGVYAVAMLRGRQDRYYRLGFLIPFTVAAVLMPFQIAVGDSAARWVYNNEPTKFAAMELVPRTATHVPETIGGSLVNGHIKGPHITIPGVASFLSGWSTNTRVRGLDAVPATDRPPATIVHLAWDTMVGLGTALLGLAVWFAWVWWRRRDVTRARWFLRAASLAGAASVVTMWAGWTVTEVGRQPYIVFGVLRTDDAVTRAPGIWVTFTVVVLIYAVLTVATFLVLRSMTRRWRLADEGVDDRDVPYGPARRLDDDAGDALATR